MFTCDTTVWIDLEQTIIASFADPVLCNVTRIRNFLKKNGVKVVHIFSYAIYNEHDQEVFVRDMKPAIEEALGVEVMTWPTVKDMIRADFRFTGTRFDPDFEVCEYIQLRGKQQGFINYIQSRCNFKRAVLIDDVVPDQTLVDRRKGWQIEFYNVDRL